MIACCLLLSGCGSNKGSEPPTPPPNLGSEPPRAQPAAAIPKGSGYLVARVLPGRSVVARERPRGKLVGRVGARTEFGGPQVMWVRRVARKGRWLAVSTPLRRGTRPQWIRSNSRDIVLGRTSYSLRVLLSERRLEFRDGKRVVRRMPVAVGRATNSTPTGRFAVTDSLKGEPFGADYGCCILAITARQPNLPPGWIGDDRVAIHGTAHGGTGSESTGCIRPGTRDLRWLVRHVRLGMPVFIER